jgi:hypothetical protein
MQDTLLKAVETVQDVDIKTVITTVVTAILALIGFFAGSKHGQKQAMKTINQTDAIKPKNYN